MKLCNLQVNGETHLGLVTGRGVVDADCVATVKSLAEHIGAPVACSYLHNDAFPADHPLWNARNCVVTPHIAGDMSLPYTVDQTVGFFCENLKRYSEGGAMLHRVDVGAGY